MLSVPAETEKTTRRPLEENMFSASAGVVWEGNVSLDALPVCCMELIPHQHDFLIMRLDKLVHRRYFPKWDRRTIIEVKRTG